MTRSRSLWTIVVALLAAPNVLPAPADRLPKCPPGWQVEVVAAVPKILHPSVVCCAPDGRVFVAEDPMDMGNDSTKPTDRVLCFHPDGRVTVFAENLHAVFGLAYIDGKVYIHHCPKFTVFTDDNGVGKDRKDLIATTNPRPNTGFNDHIPSNIRLGMDGWLYMSTGDKGIYGAVGTDGSAAEIRGGGVLRFRPDGSHLEVYSTGTRNHLDVAVNAEDEIFTYDNTDDGNGWWTRVTHMVDGGFYGYPWDYKPRRPYTLWMMTDYGGGSPTGALAYNDDALPAEYRGNLFLCEWGRKQLLRLTVVRDGGTYKILKREDFLTAGSEEFRPVGIAVSPDGMSLYVADWNFGGWKQNTPAGRLLKVTYTGKSEAAPKPAWYVPAATSKPFEATTAELVEGLKHPAQSVRLVAQRRLAERGVAAVEPTVALLKDSKAPAFARWSAIWTLDAIDAGKPGRAAILGVLADPDASVRRQAARELGTRAAKDAVAGLINLLSDADISVRFQAATALGRIGDAGAVPALLAALDQTDLFTRYAVFTALNRIGRSDSTAWKAIVAGFSSTQVAVRAGAAFATRNTFGEALVTALRDFAVDSRNTPEARAAAVAALAPLHRKPPAWKGDWWGTQPVKSPRPAGSVDWAGTPVVVATLTKSLGDDAPAVRRAAAEGAETLPDAQLVAPLVALFARDEAPETRRAVLRAVAGSTEPAPATDLVLTVLSHPKEHTAVLADAVPAAGKIGGPKMIAALTALVAADVPPDALGRAITALGKLKATGAVPAIAGRVGNPDAAVRAAAVEALTTIGGPAAVKALLPLLADPKPEARRVAVMALGALKTPAAIEPLLKAYADPETRHDAIPALASTPDVRALNAYLEGLGGKNATVREACAKAVAGIRAEALPLIEARLDQSPPLPQTAIAELQRVYTTAAPITTWRVVGSFDPKAANPFDPAAPPASGEYKDSQGKTARWHPAKVDPTGRVDLHRQGFTSTSNAAAFAVAEVESTAARPVELIAGSDDGLVLWVNGTKVFEDLNNRGFRADQFRIKAALKAGRNVIVAKITQNGGPWEFAVAVPGAGTGRLFAASAEKPDPGRFEAFAKSHAGDPGRGKKLFNDLKGLACAKCHRAGGAEGGDVGPDLGGVGAKYNRQQLIESVLYPSRQILDGYQQTRVVTAEGKVFSGVVRGETPAELTLVDADGKKVTLPKADVEERKVLEKSLMPEGLQAGLSTQDFADLVTYLEGLKEKPPEKKE